jgi:hypothetical protein
MNAARASALRPGSSAGAAAARGRPGPSAGAAVPSPSAAPGAAPSGPGGVVAGGPAARAACCSREGPRRAARRRRPAAAAGTSRPALPARPRRPSMRWSLGVGVGGRVGRQRAARRRGRCGWSGRGGQQARARPLPLLPGHELLGPGCAPAAAGAAFCQPPPPRHRHGLPAAPPLCMRLLPVSRLHAARASSGYVRSGRAPRRRRLQAARRRGMRTACSEQRVRSGTRRHGRSAREHPRSGCVHVHAMFDPPEARSSARSAPARQKAPALLVPRLPRGLWASLGMAADSVVHQLAAVLARGRAHGPAVQRFL